MAVLELAPVGIINLNYLNSPSRIILSIFSRIAVKGSGMSGMSIENNCPLS